MKMKIMSFIHPHVVVNYVFASSMGKSLKALVRIHWSCIESKNLHRFSPFIQETEMSHKLEKNVGE